MTASGRRSLFSIAALALGAFVFWVLRDNWLLAAAAALAVFVIGGFIGNRQFQRAASIDEKIADLRDRVDNPPS